MVLHDVLEKPKSEEEKMEIVISRFLQILILCFLTQYLVIAQEFETGDVESTLETYIVHVSKPLKDISTLSDDHLESWYSSFLPKSTTSASAQSLLLHSYRHVISGFAAKLTAEEVREMEKKDGFIYAMKQNVYSLHTTHTPSFLGLHQNIGFWQGSNYGEGIIIGFLDGGITPDHPSFSDDGMHPPPGKWKGKCEGGIICNNKLIGARNLANASEAAIDGEGHGTHTSSTAAGNFVSNANVFGQANGTASGMAPRAHVAMYKVCSVDCLFTDILAGMDAAIEDGVDVISYSLGAGSLPFYADSLTVAAYSAIQKGIIVSASAGNGGPSSGRLSNESPWLLTVGASTVDRSFRATITLGNSETLDGQSIFQPDFPSTLLPLVYYVANGNNGSYCDPGSLDFSDVKGKIVVCLLAGKAGGVVKGQTVKDAGGAAMIIINTEVQGYSIIPDIHVLPAAHVSYEASQKILAYLNSTSNPKAAISFKGTSIGAKDAPSVAHFSSRGPSLASPGILKPDILGPGVSILAAWPISLEGNNNTKSTFNILPGTSMSCPHLSGIAAILKKSHPHWSPAAIKSAIMTTADSLNLNKQPIMDERMQPANIFALGAGHVNPPKANDPGLVYDIQPEDYIPYLCGLGYTNKQIEMIVKQKINCAKIKGIEQAQLNYPSFAINITSSGNKTYTRTVTNVGESKETYDLKINQVPEVNIDVNPAKLVFTSANQKITYQVTFTRNASIPASAPYVEGAIVWSSVKHVVTSKISIQLT